MFGVKTGGEKGGKNWGRGLLPQDENHRERRAGSWSQREGPWAGIVL